MKAAPSKVLLVAAFVFFLLATLVAGGVVTSDTTWFLPAGLSSLVLAFLV